jgi:hypothetical protein
MTAWFLELVRKVDDLDSPTEKVLGAAVTDGAWKFDDVTGTRTRRSASVPKGTV